MKFTNAAHDATSLGSRSPEKTSSIGVSTGHKNVSSLSGNEIFCLNELGFQPGQLCVGNSVVSIGMLGGALAGLGRLGGGEVKPITDLVRDSRDRAFQRLLEEAKAAEGQGVTGVALDMINHRGNLEFLAIGSSVKDPKRALGPLEFSTSGSAQSLYCQMDAGFSPVHFVFGNVAYSIGLGKGIMGRVKKIARGEVAEFTSIFDETRHLALTRITEEAARYHANAVVGIETTISPLLGTQEMVMAGTAAHHDFANLSSEPITSDMTGAQLWSMIKMGYMPVRLVLGVSVYSLGMVGNLGVALRSMTGGEVGGLTRMLYEARERALDRVHAEAQKYGADQVVGVKTKINELGNGLVEFMAIGTAVKKIPQASTRSPSLISQAILSDEDTLLMGALDLKSARFNRVRRLQGWHIFVFIFVTVMYMFRLLLSLHTK